MHTKRPTRFYKYTMWLVDADYERAEPGLDYVIRPSKFAHKDIYVFPREHPLVHCTNDFVTRGS